MDEQYISYETAKLADEKGVDLYTKIIYVETEEHTMTDHHNGNEYTFEYKPPHLHHENFNHSYDKLLCKAYNQTILHKWLREVNNIHVEIHRDEDMWKFELYTIIGGNKHIPTEFKNYSTYEDALEGGLVAGLNLIK